MCLLNPGDNSWLKTKQSVQIADACKAEGTTAVFWQKKSLQRLTKIYFTLLVTMLQFCETFKQLTPGHRLIIYSYSSADKNSAFSESYMIHVRSKCKNRVEMLYLRICGVMSIDFEINLVISIWCSLGRYSTPWLEVCSMKTEIMQFDKYVC